MWTRNNRIANPNNDDRNDGSAFSLYLAILLNPRDTQTVPRYVKEARHKLIQTKKYKTKERKHKTETSKLQIYREGLKNSILPKLLRRGNLYRVANPSLAPFEITTQPLSYHTWITIGPVIFIQSQSRTNGPNLLNNSSERCRDIWIPVAPVT
ncbi:hypothetical protein GBA52_022151 [Prunus armeniaca]|nr:hypothetical protein GBA52_022151 [Prunus armeniaca]